MIVSVIIPLYNKENFVAGTIKSVLSQTYTDFELIIINDGSTDGSAQIATSFYDHRIRYTEQPNRGVSIARNKGISIARGEYIAFLDADDKWSPDYLEKMALLSQQYPSYSVFCSSQEKRPINTLPTGISIIEDYCTYYYIFWTGCMFIKKDVFDKVGGFREGIQLGEDSDMWLRISCIYKTIFLNEELACHPYITENNLARTVDIAKSFPYWEWYNYPYPNIKSLYKYTTNQIVRCAKELTIKRRYSNAWFFLRKTRGTTSIIPRIKLLFKIIFRK